MSTDKSKTKTENASHVVEKNKANLTKEQVRGFLSRFQAAWAERSPVDRLRRLKEVADDMPSQF